MLIDTHQVVEDIIKSGLKKNQAEIITRAINQSNEKLATQVDISYVKNNMATQLDIIEIKTELKWMRILMLAILGLLIKLTFF